MLPIFMNNLNISHSWLRCFEDLPDISYNMLVIYIRVMGVSMAGIEFINIIRKMRLARLTI